MLSLLVLGKTNISIVIGFLIIEVLIMKENVAKVHAIFDWLAINMSCVIIIVCR